MAETGTKVCKLRAFLTPCASAQAYNTAAGAVTKEVAQIAVTSGVSLGSFSLTWQKAKG